MDPLERVSYYGGQRLMAADLNQQELYEITLRRLLNSGLFSSGVVKGLEVTKASPRTLLVATGLALDHLGRELYLVAPRDVAIPNQQPAPSSGGFYLIIRYRETPIPGGQGDCWPSARGVPTYRYRLDPILELTDVYPDPRRCRVSDKDPEGDFNCGVVLALVRVNASCEIDKVETGFRQFSYPIHASRVTAMAFEGEKDIDAANRKRLRFHVRGAAPNSALLYLRGAQFSTLYYTELGSHQHALAIAGSLTGLASTAIAHTHSLQGAGSADAGTHSHQLLLTSVGWSYSLAGSPLVPGAYRSAADLVLGQTLRRQFIEDASGHSHSLIGATQGAAPATSGAHQHASAAISTGTAVTGATVAARPNGEAARGYLDRLQVRLDNIDITGDLLQMLGWKSLGDSSSGHPINQLDGTGTIDLLRLGSVGDIDMGPHELVFSIAEGGGRLIWNLYIE